MADHGTEVGPLGAEVVGPVLVLLADVLEVVAVLFLRGAEHLLEFAALAQTGRYAGDAGLDDRTCQSEHVAIGFVVFVDLCRGDGGVEAVVEPLLFVFVGEQGAAVLGDHLFDVVAVARDGGFGGGGLDLFAHPRVDDRLQGGQTVFQRLAGFDQAGYVVGVEFVFADGGEYFALIDGIEFQFVASGCQDQCGQ